MKPLLSLILFSISLGVFAQEIQKDTLLKPALSLENQEEKSHKPDLNKAISKIWELDREDQRGTFRFLEYLPMYVMPFRFTHKPIEQPQGLNTERPIPERRDYQSVETKFQVSLKAKIMQDAFGKGDVWVAFTQQAYWQMYNGELSRPFRELNYEPELIFTYPTNLSVGNFKLKMLGLSVNHQSNGKEAAHSRSWNRFILMGVAQWGDVLLTARFRKRISEKRIEDDNPEIENYIGRCEIRGAVPFRKNLFSFVVRNNLNFNTNRGHVELSWIYPLNRELRVILQASHGYGDSLIDYNYKQTILGVGFTFLNI